MHVQSHRLTRPRLAVILILRCPLDAGLIMFGMCCSSFVPICRASTGRRKGRPMGNTRFAKVRTANLLSCRWALENPSVYHVAKTQKCRRLALLAQLAEAVGACWVVEQPAGSLLWETDRLQGLKRQWEGLVQAAWFPYSHKTL